MPDYASIASNALWGLLPVAGVFALLALVTKRRGIIAAIARSRREFGTNFGLMVINTILLAPLAVFIKTALVVIFGNAQVLTGFWEQTPAWLVLVIAILVIDLAAYWRHRLEHSPKWWRIHATHHADEAIHWLSVQRKHPLGSLLSAACDFLILIMLGMPIWAMVTAALVRGWWAYFIHADVPWTLGPLGKVLISPAAHRLHHIRDEELMGTNFGNTVTLWDRLFGTYLDPAPYINCETGIAEGTRGLRGELWRPFEKRYRQKAEPAEAAQQTA